MNAFLDKEASIAPSGFNRFLVPPAALAVHLSIGQVYAFSTFNLPLTKLIGITKSVPGDWTVKEVGWIFSIAIVVLGSSAALLGRWVERAGPRKAMFVSALCFSGGFMISALGIRMHQLWMLYLGYGVLGGCGMGIGYISPVSTLIKWFPDRPGMATGMAIMGFGGGALIAAPLSVMLMAHFKTATASGVLETFVTMGVIYFMYMMIGVYTMRVPAADWTPDGWSAPAQPRSLITTEGVEARVAWRTPQFWLLWGVLCMNVSAGIGMLSQASPMIQEIFGVLPPAAAGFVGILSLANMVGRFFWATASDYIGRRNTYMAFFLLGILLYCLVPTMGHLGLKALFVTASCIILSMYGGGFATIPAYLRDLFGTLQVGAIHGRLLTAWSVAGVLGPQLFTYLRDRQLHAGVPKAHVYSTIMYIMSGLLLIGFFCNLSLRPVDSRFHHKSNAKR